MRALTPAEIGLALLVITLAEAVVFGLAIIAILCAAKDAVDKERRRSRAQIADRADRLARRRVREILSNIRITAPVRLINESDIDWGEEEQR